MTAPATIHRADQRSPGSSWCAATAGFDSRPGTPVMRAALRGGTLSARCRVTPCIENKRCRVSPTPMWKPPDTPIDDDLVAQRVSVNRHFISQYARRVPRHLPFQPFRKVFQYSLVPDYLAGRPSALAPVRMMRPRDGRPRSRAGRRPPPPATNKPVEVLKLVCRQSMRRLASASRTFVN
jgi:hypothetical protein